MAKYYFVVFFVFVATQFKTSQAIDCYRCTGTNNTSLFQCNEWLDNDIDLEPQSCDDVYGAKYCIKHIGRFEGGVGAKRFCSSLDLGNYCNYVRQPGDILPFYRTCIFTCTGDGCNAATAINPTIPFLIPIIAAAFHYVS